MVSVKKLSRFGFGAYRISTPEHMEALKLALNSGFTVIDTSTNYTDGMSEKIIGDVIQNFPRENILISSKAGYIQNADLEYFSSHNSEDVCRIGSNFQYCIHPGFLSKQLERSTERLKTCPDVYLLHNPEYYLRNKGRNAFKTAIFSAFEFLESCVSEGRIQSYGVSSNIYGCLYSVDGRPNADGPRLSDLIGIAKQVGGQNHNFRHLQVPFNIFETGIFTNISENDQCVLDIAQENGIQVYVNRVLHSLPPSGLWVGTDWQRETSYLKLAPDPNTTYPALRLVENTLRDLLEEEVPNLSLSQMCLHFASSVPNIGVVLVGCRSEQYVQSIRELMDKELLSSEGWKRVMRRFDDLLEEFEKTGTREKGF